MSGTIKTPLTLFFPTTTGALPSPTSIASSPAQETLTWATATLPPSSGSTTLPSISRMTGSAVPHVPSTWACDGNTSVRQSIYCTTKPLPGSRTRRLPSGTSPLPLSERTFPEIGTNWKNYQPRVGFAYNPQQFNGKLVVRGGFAINFDPAFYNMFTNAATAAPVVNLGTIPCDGVTTVCQSGAGALGKSDPRSIAAFYSLGRKP